MRKLIALFAAAPLLALAQEATPQAQQPPAQQEPAQQPPANAPPAAQPAPQPAQAAPPPPQYPPPPHYAPPPPHYAPPPRYAPPPPQYPPPPGTPQQPYQAPQKQRGSWYIGFGLGSGDGSLELTDGTADFKELVGPGRDTFSFNFRVGATMSPRLLLGLDAGFVGATSDAGGFDSSVDLSYFDVGVMFFPMEKGFYLRGGVGLSTVSQTLETAFGDTDYSANGVNVLGGVGYAFWLGRTFNLTLNVDAQRHVFNEDNVEGGTAWSAWVGFDWY